MDVEHILSQMTLEEKAAFCSGGDFWHTKALERLGVPSVMMCDGPHGLRKQGAEADHLGINDSIKAVCFPTAAALAASFDRSLLHTLGEVLGEECQAEDVSMLLGPGLNIKRSPLCGRNFEYFSEDPYLAGQLAAAYVNGLQGKGIAACPKHFAANNQETLRMSGSSEVDERTLHEIYLSAFEDMVKESAPRSMMCSYNQINGVYASENRELLTEILRDQWGFDGFVVTDWGAGKDRVKGIAAGVDLEMPGRDNPEQVAKIVAAVQSGELPEEQLDQTVSRILTYIKGYMDGRRPEAQLDLETDHIRSVHASEECAVLLKNARDILPLSKEQRVAFLGDFARAPRYQGAGSSHINSHKVVGAVEAAQAAGLNVTFAQGYLAQTSEPNPDLLERAAECAKRADVAVIFAGLPDSYESEGFDRTSMAMPANQNALIEAVASVNPNTVVVLHNGSPVEMPWADQAAAILELYLGGEGVGEAAVDLLYGTANPSGKLAETFPIKLEDNPSFLNFPGEDGIVEYREGVFVGYRYYDKKKMAVRFPFGHGLSYTSFVYGDIQLDKAQLTDRESLTVTCKVKNTGTRLGKEVIQLYVRDEQSRVNRPVRELKGFEKVELAPGEEKTVSFTLGKKAFAYYEPKIHDWFVESGTFTIEIGSSSRDIRLAAQVTVEGTVTLPVHFTEFSTFGQILATPKGQTLIGHIFQKFSAGAAGQHGDIEADAAGMQTMQSMMMDMTLDAVSKFIGMTDEQISGILAELN
ncbi:MAG: glycoside hydrolase family 3 C-terminal domain-containing protein [Oscillospiraceae bacterium]|nr:glycoside hydrolase family 3 C-terminal domain-containing protein [Oscillospiraceae bacterium]